MRLGPVVWIGVGAAVVITGITVGFLPPGEDEKATGGSVAAATPAVKIEDDPAADGWDTERFHQAAEAQLQVLMPLLFSSHLEADQVRPLVAPEFSCVPLRPSDLLEVFHDEQFTVQRALDLRTREENDLATDQQTGRFTGPAGLAEALGALAQVLAGTTEQHASIKIFRLRKHARGVATTALLEASGRAAEHVVQVSATWRIHWVTEEGGPPRIASIGVARHEEVVFHSEGGPLFADCTLSVLGGNETFRDQFLVGVDRWMERNPKFAGLVRWGDQGAALGDVNGDSLDDLYVCEPTSLPNRLFVRAEDGTAHDTAQAAGVDWLDHTRSALLIDLDNDGDQDLVVATGPAVLVAENDGTGRFTLRSTIRSVRDAHSLAAADYNNDGLLDVFACVYHGDDNAPDVFPLPLPYHDATNGGANALLRGDGDLQFTDVTAESGLGEDNHRWSLAAAWEDYDGDGDVDLYIANDFGRNKLYRNDGGRFTNVAAEAGVEDVGSGMSVAWGDYNHDGQMDLYVSNMFSTAGGRIAFQDQFQAGASEASKDLYRRMAAGNSLFENQGDGTFRNVAAEAAVQMGRWAWGSQFIDLNNDSWEDLVVTNGFLTRDDPRDL